MNSLFNTYPIKAVRWWYIVVVAVCLGLMIGASEHGCVSTTSTTVRWWDITKNLGIINPQSSAYTQIRPTLSSSRCRLHIKLRKNDTIVNLHMYCTTSYYQKYKWHIFLYKFLELLSILYTSGFRWDLPRSRKLITHPSLTLASLLLPVKHIISFLLPPKEIFYPPTQKINI